MFADGTEPAFDNAYFQHKEFGVYTCGNCGAHLFSSDSKFDSGSGWPAFDQFLDQDYFNHADTVFDYG